MSQRTVLVDNQSFHYNKAVEGFNIVCNNCVSYYKTTDEIEMNNGVETCPKCKTSGSLQNLAK